MALALNKLNKSLTESFLMQLMSVSTTEKSEKSVLVPYRVSLSLRPAHTERNGVIRIISARKATRQEKNTYYDYLAQTT